MRITTRAICLTMSAIAVFPLLGNAADVSVTISGEVAPGVYGRVDLGNRPPPPLVYAHPIVVEHVSTTVQRVQPIYLHVPPGHARNWSKHCREYRACDRPVYFVRSAEYDDGNKPAHGRNGHRRDK